MSNSHFNFHCAILAVALSYPLSTLSAQPRLVLKGHLHPRAEARYDEGAVESSTRMELTLMLQRTSAQQSELDMLLAAQHDTASPQYHRWLTPEQFADRFGASQSDVDRLSQWLASNGFSDSRISRGRDFISFTAAAGQVEAALHTPIHRFRVAGEAHYSNAAEPSVPEELSHLIAGFRGLNDFRPKPPHRNNVGRPVSIKGKALRPDFYTQLYPGVNVLAPDDLATIYNVNALYRAGIDGTGQLIAVAGESDIDLNDIRNFRQAFGLPARDPRMILVPGSQNPGKNGAEGEADLDLEWAGAVARNATVLYVFSQDAFDSAFYAIDQALAPVLTFSFGGCELRMTKTDIATISGAAQKAAAEGITWIASSGDSGSAGCEDQNGGGMTAITRMNVNVPASLPWVTGVGGSEFNEGRGNYWAGSLRSNGGSALSYIPEGAWTDEDYIAQNEGAGFASSGGGASRFFAKPTWQAGLGVPNDGHRDVPDVALTASWFHDPYALITGGEFVPNGGTSAAAPTFAGMVVLLNQYLMAAGAQQYPGLGNINPALYHLAQTAPSAFHDITSGSNIVPCVIDSTQDCATGYMGFQAGTGYDQVTGLGSVDAFALAHAWSAATSRSARLAVTQFTTSTKVQVGGSWNLNLVIANQGTADAGAFEMRVYLTANGDMSTASPHYVYCDAKSLAAGASFTCSGTLTLNSGIGPGVYVPLAIADYNNDPGNIALALPMTVSR
jgi:subtilase family serine protease